MQNTFRLWVSVVAVWGLGLFVSVANSAAQSANLDVSVSVSNECTITTSALSFGAYTTIAGSEDDDEGGITITCTEGADPYRTRPWSEYRRPFAEIVGREPDPRL